MSSINNQEVEGILWKQNKTLTGTKWKKRWVYCDGVTLLQWPTEAKPTKSSEPKHKFKVATCTVREIKTDKPYSFSVIDKISGHNNIFSANKVTEYATWLSVLTRVAEEEKYKREQKQDDDEKPEELKTEIARSYFEKRRVTHQQGDFEVISSELPTLLKKLNISLDDSKIIKTSKMLTRPSGTIQYSDFMRWYQNYETLKECESETKNSDDLAVYNNQGEENIVNKERSASAVSAPSDVVQTLLRSGSVWNTCMDPTHLSSFLDLNEVDKKKSVMLFESLANRRIPNVENVVDSWDIEVPKDWNDAFQSAFDAADSVSVGDSNELDPSSLYSLMALYGFFLSTAITGSQTIIDEYTLPATSKKAKQINLDDLDANYTSKEDMISDRKQEIFILNGIVFQLMTTSSSVRDRDNKLERLQFVMSSDELLHKIAGNDLRNASALRDAINNLSCAKENVGEWPKIYLLLSCIVDFCGFRCQAFCPISLDEQVTLVYGTAAENGVFVNAIPYLPLMMKAIGDNIRLDENKVSMVTSSAILSHPRKHLKHTVCSIISKELQIHQCADKRLYALNFNGLMPPDLPRPDSHDTFTRFLRPEYLQDYAHTPISCEALKNDLIHQNTAPAPVALSDEGEYNTENEIAMKESAQELQERGKEIELKVNNLLEVARTLQEVAIPNLVCKLDMMCTFPVDSYSFTRLMHSSGINLRYVGVIYTLSNIPHVKSLVLVEGIARCCKIVLGQILRNIARRGRGESLVAEQRHRSKLGNFVVHQSELLTSKRDTVVAIFNLIFGRDDESELFWKEILFHILISKFNFDANKLKDFRQRVHLPQLYYAVQYHTGVSFEENIIYDHEIEKPFENIHLHNIAHNIKFPMCYPGIFYKYNSLCDALLATNRYEEAINVLKLRLSSLLIIGQTMDVVCNRLKYETNATVYTLALCHHLLTNHVTAGAILKGALEEFPRYSPITGRMMTLLMCTEFCAGKMNEAMKYYDTAKEILKYSLGSRHPSLALLDAALADMYFKHPNGLMHAKLMNLQALEFSNHVLGDMHVLSVTLTYRLGCILLKEPSLEEANAMFKVASNQFILLSEKGADFDCEIAMCLHGQAIVAAEFGNIEEAKTLCVKSLSRSAADDKHLSSDVTSCLMLLAVLTERSNEAQAAIELYTDVWNIVKASPQEHDGGAVFTSLTAKMFSSYLNMQPLQTKMLFDSIASEVTNPTQRDLNLASTFVAKEVWKRMPMDYISSLVKSLNFKYNQVSDQGIAGYSQGWASVSGAVMSTVGVPTPSKSRTLLLSSKPKGQHEADVDNEEEFDEDLESKRLSIRVKDNSIPLTLQAVTVLRLILHLS